MDSPFLSFSIILTRSLDYFGFRRWSNKSRRRLEKNDRVVSVSTVIFLLIDYQEVLASFSIFEGVFIGGPALYFHEGLPEFCRSFLSEL